MKPKKVTKEVRRTRVIRNTVTFTRTELLDLLRGNDASLGSMGPLPEIPDNAELFVEVPGGEDYSTCDLTLHDNAVDLYVRWETEESF